MKKLISVLAALVLTCMTCVTAMAATIPSPAKEIIPERGTVTTMDGEVIEINDSETLKKYLEIRNSDVSAEEIAGYSSIAVFEVKFNGITSADVVLHVSGVKAGDTIIVRMLVNGQWVDVEAEVIGDNQVRVKLTQEGTIEILKASISNGGNGTGDNSGNGTDGNNSTNSSQGSNTSATSPKTGETNVLPAAYAAFAVCVAVAAVAGMKLRKKAR